MKLLADLLVNSYQGNYSAINQVIIDFLASHTTAKIICQKISEQKENIIAVFGTPRTLINCHTDTVPPAGSWEKDPHLLSQENDRFYGLGTTDTKGNIYALLTTIAQLPPQNTLLLFSVEEESGSIESGVTFFLTTPLSQGIEEAYVCEPTNGEIVNQHQGYYSYELRLTTAGGHSSQIEQYHQNAIARMAEYIPLLIKKGFNVAKIQGGTKGNIIPDHCTLFISIRTDKTESVIKDMLKSVLSDKIIIKEKTILPPFYNSQITGKEVSFWTEAALFQQAGISTRVVGAGNIAQAHSENEFVEKQEIEKMQVFFQNLIKGNL